MRKLFLASAICSAIFLLFVIDPRLPGARFGVVFKVASIGLLAVMASTTRPQQRLLAIALSISAWGDLLLDLKHLGSFGRVQLFLFGLVSFLIAHLFYVVLFLKSRSHDRVSAIRKLACAVLVLVALATMRILWPGLAEMRTPVLVYSAVLTTMAVTAQLSRFSKLVAIGALSFFASDTMLAMDIFGHPFHGSRTLVWITYYAAQAMIAVGVSRRQEKSFASEAGAAQ